MSSLFKKINNLITAKIVLILGAIFALSYAFMNTFFISLFSKESKGFTYIENMIRYNSENLYKLISNYRSIGRNAYVKYSVSFDFIFPLICSLFFISFTIYLFKKISLSSFWQKAALVVGICFCLLDWIENILLIIIVYSFPQKLQLISNIVSFVTLSKSFISIVFFAIVIIGSFILFGLFIRKRKNN